MNISIAEDFGSRKWTIQKQRELLLQFNKFADRKIIHPKGAG
jgi:hypothetical protein